MKRLAITTLAVLALSIVSCKKEYTCVCKKTHNIGTGTEITTEDGTLTFKDNLARAEQRCNDEERTGTDIGGDYVRNCDIK